jgi:hypothetical protein
MAPSRGGSRLPSVRIRPASLVGATCLPSYPTVLSRAQEVGKNRKLRSGRSGSSTSQRAWLLFNHGGFSAHEVFDEQYDLL